MYKTRSQSYDTYIVQLLFLFVYTLPYTDLIGEILLKSHVRGACYGRAFINRCIIVDEANESIIKVAFCR